MQNLKKALEIFLKYKPLGGTAAEHDVLYFVDIEENTLSKEDKEVIDSLPGFFYDEENECWAKFT